jgi:hypothetical protein
MDVRFPTLLVDPWQLLGFARPDTLPTTIVLGPDRAVIEVLRGPQTVESVAAVIERAAAG